MTNEMMRQPTVAILVRRGGEDFEAQVKGLIAKFEFLGGEPRTHFYEDILCFEYDAVSGVRIFWHQSHNAAVTEMCDKFFAPTSVAHLDLVGREYD